MSWAGALQGGATSFVMTDDIRQFLPLPPTHLLEGQVHIAVVQRRRLHERHAVRLTEGARLVCRHPPPLPTRAARRLTLLQGQQRQQAGVCWAAATAV